MVKHTQPMIRWVIDDVMIGATVAGLMETYMSHARW